MATVNLKGAKKRVQCIEKEIACLNTNITNTQNDISNWREEIKDWETKLRRAKKRYAAELRIKAIALES